MINLLFRITPASMKADMLTFALFAFMEAVTSVEIQLQDMLGRHEVTSCAKYFQN